MERFAIDSSYPSAESVAHAASIIQRGGIVVIPTDTLYGVAADPTNPDAVAKVFAAKGRPDGKPLLLVAANVDQVERLVGVLAGPVRALAARFWPGPLTLLFAAPGGLADAVAAGSGRIGLRVPAHAVTRALCAAVGGPITATSANRSGEASVADPQALDPALLAGVDALIDAGVVAGGMPSTVVDIAAGAPRLIREGAISWSAVEQCWTRT